MNMDRQCIYVSVSTYYIYTLYDIIYNIDFLYILISNLYPEDENGASRK